MKYLLSERQYAFAADNEIIHFSVFEVLSEENRPHRNIARSHAQYLKFIIMYFLLSTRILLIYLSIYLVERWFLLNLVYLPKYFLWKWYHYKFLNKLFSYNMFIITFPSFVDHKLNYQFIIILILLESIHKLDKFLIFKEIFSGF